MEADVILRNSGHRSSSCVCLEKLRFARILLITLLSMFMKEVNKN